MQCNLYQVIMQTDMNYILWRLIFACIVPIAYFEQRLDNILNVKRESKYHLVLLLSLPILIRLSPCFHMEKDLLYSRL